MFLDSGGRRGPDGPAGDSISDGLGIVAQFSCCSRKHRCRQQVTCGQQWLEIRGRLHAYYSYVDRRDMA